MTPGEARHLARLALSIVGASPVNNRRNGGTAGTPRGIRDEASRFDPSSAPETPHGRRSFRFRVRRHRRRYERPPSLSYRANVGQDLLSFVFGHFALRVRQVIETLLDFRPKLRAADFAVLLQGRLPGSARGFDFRC